MQWASGDRVIVRGEHWRILRTTAFADCAALDLVSQQRPGITRTVLVPFDRPRLAPSPRPAILPTRRWCENVSALVADSFPFGGLRYCPSAIRLLPYQLEPALAVFRHGATRLLIADDVGVGKTVEAGLIVREVMGARHGARILILTPSSLKDQWRQELRTLFAVEAIDAGAGWLRQSSAALPASVNPWSLPGVYLASTDFVKRAEALGPLEGVRWDLLVQDEAHAATPGSHRKAAVHALACRSRLVVLLTATPHAGDEGQFAELCATGRVDPAEPIVCFRRSRADVLPVSGPVKSRIVRVRLSDDERRLQRELDSYTARLWQRGTGGADANPGLLATILRKRALSSAGSLVQSLERRLVLMEAPAAREVQLWLPLDHDDGEQVDDLPADRVLGGPGLGDDREERAVIQRTLEAAAAAARSESKMRVLLRLLRRVREPAIVFSEYRDTTDRLREVLEAHGHRVIVLHGGLSPAERRVAVADFNQGGAMLVSTDAASEGLNLHHQCRLVIHFELPWTPLRLYQRCGRVNRIGQRRQVHEIALVFDDTAEQLVISPLIRRLGVAGSFGGGSVMAQLSEPRVAARVLGGAPAPSGEEPSAVPRDLVIMSLRDEGIAEAERLELVRRLRRHAPAADDGPPVIPAGHLGRRAGRGAPTLTILVQTTIGDGAELPLEQDAVAVHVPHLLCRRRRRWRHREAASLVERMGREIPKRLARRTRERLARVRAMRDQVQRAAGRREAAMDGALQSAARALVQAGLFDRPGPRPTSRWTPAQGFAEPARADREGRRRPVRARIRLCAVMCGRLE